jgi:hypothetical protein
MVDAIDIAENVPVPASAKGKRTANVSVNDSGRVNFTKYGNTNEYSSVGIIFHRPERKELDNTRH